MTRERKIILIGGVVILAVGAIYRFWPAIAPRLVIQGPAPQEVERLQRYRAMAAGKEALQEEWVALNRAVARAESFLLAGDTPALAEVDLQNFLTETARSAALEIQSMRGVGRSGEEDTLYPAVRVQVQFQGDIAALQQFLYRIGAAPQLTRVIEARFQVSNENPPRTLRGNLTVEGLMAKREG